MLKILNLTEVKILTSLYTAKKTLSMKPDLYLPKISCNNIMAMKCANYCLTKNRLFKKYNLCLCQDINTCIKNVK